MRGKDKPMARFYGLPKMRKTDVLLQPIVAFSNTNTYNLAKCTSKTLKPLIETSLATVKAATSFLRQIQDVTIADDEVMVSFDNVSSFTSISQYVACMAIRHLLESGHDNVNLITDEMMTLLEFCNALNTVFTLDEKIYQLVKGTLTVTPMHVLPSSPPNFLARYVDYVFGVIERNNVDMLWDQLNSLFPAILFERPLEQDNQFAFLDV